MGSFRVPWSRRFAALAAAAAGGLAIATMTAVPAAAVGDIVNAGIPNAIPNSYIVVFKSGTMNAQGVDNMTADLAGQANAKVDYKYKHALRGFAGTMSETAARKLAANPNVAYVEQNGTVQAVADQPSPPSWGLDRIDQRNLPLDNNYHYDTTASNVTGYIIDTGIRVTHQQFAGRTPRWGTNTTGDGMNTDCNGHGTHVSGTVGGSTFGVAKGINLVAVKVLNCQGSGSFAGVAQGIDWVTGDHQAGQLAVANMSLGGSGSDPTGEAAVRNAIADGVVFSIASGNSNSDACNFTPAREPLAITVNASDINDARASFSNFGTCTDIFAPGVNITSAWMTNDTATNTISGTSMATPHVTGVSALYLSTHAGATPAQVQQALKDNSTPNKITNPGSGSPNRLLYSIFPTSGGPTVNNPGNQTSTVGTPVSLTVSASGGTAPYTWSASGLPPGLSIGAGPSTSTTISGTPTTAGTFNVTVTASGGGTGSTSFTWTVNGGGGGCSSPGQKLLNPGFESGAVSWSATAGVIGQWGASGQPTHGGSWNAWMDGYGTTHTDTLSQTVTIPAGCSNSTLSFWLHIDTSETTTSIQYDRLTVQVGSTTLATYSNLNRAAGYSLKSFNVGAFAGQTVTIKFTGSEDFSLQTSFVVDDSALNAG
jgi:subtilisin family serine protease